MESRCRDFFSRFRRVQLFVAGFEVFPSGSGHVKLFLAWDLSAMSLCSWMPKILYSIVLVVIDEILSLRLLTQFPVPVANLYVFVGDITSLMNVRKVIRWLVVLSALWCLAV